MSGGTRRWTETSGQPSAESAATEEGIPVSSEGGAGEAVEKKINGVVDVH